MFVHPLLLEKVFQLDIAGHFIADYELLDKVPDGRVIRYSSQLLQILFVNPSTMLREAKPSFLLEQTFSANPIRKIVYVVVG